MYVFTICKLAALVVFIKLEVFNFCCKLQRVPKLQQQDQAIWWDTMVKMQKLLRKASLSLFNGGKIDKETMHNYFMSGECP
jgi:hypothetical protein